MNVEFIICRQFEIKRGKRRGCTSKLDTDRFATLPARSLTLLNRSCSHLYDFNSRFNLSLTLSLFHFRDNKQGETRERGVTLNRKVYRSEWKVTLRISRDSVKRLERARVIQSPLNRPYREFRAETSRCYCASRSSRSTEVPRLEVLETEAHYSEGKNKRGGREFRWKTKFISVNSESRLWPGPEHPFEDNNKDAVSLGFDKATLYGSLARV